MPLFNQFIFLINQGGNSMNTIVFFAENCALVAHKILGQNPTIQNLNIARKQHLKRKQNE